MRRRYLPAVAAAIALAVPAQALERCVVGQRVTVPGGAPGTVVAAAGADCTVKRDGAAAAEAWPARSVEPISPADVPADVAPAAGVDLGPGAYRCQYLVDDAPPLEFFDLIILDAATYADRDGRPGNYHREAHGIVFDSGPFAGRVRIAGPGNMFYLRCDPAP